MQSDPIKAALEVAARELCFGVDGEDCDACMVPLYCSKAPQFVPSAAAAIAAFLEALPKYDNEGDAIPYDAELLAAAIRRAGGAD